MRIREVQYKTDDYSFPLTGKTYEFRVWKPRPNEKDKTRREAVRALMVLAGVKYAFESSHCVDLRMLAATVYIGQRFLVKPRKLASTKQTYDKIARHFGLTPSQVRLMVRRLKERSSHTHSIRDLVARRPGRPLDRNRTKPAPKRGPLSENKSDR